MRRTSVCEPSVVAQPNGRTWVLKLSSSGEVIGLAVRSLTLGSLARHAPYADLLYTAGMRSVRSATSNVATDIRPHGDQEGHMRTVARERQLEQERTCKEPHTSC